MLITAKNGSRHKYPLNSVSFECDGEERLEGGGRRNFKFSGAMLGKSAAARRDRDVLGAVGDERREPTSRAMELIRCLPRWALKKCKSRR